MASTHSTTGLIVLALTFLSAVYRPTEANACFCEAYGNTYSPISDDNCESFVQQPNNGNHRCPMGLRFDTRVCVCNHAAVVSCAPSCGPVDVLPTIPESTTTPATTTPTTTTTTPTTTTPTTTTPTTTTPTTTTPTTTTPTTTTPTTTTPTTTTPTTTTPTTTTPTTTTPTTTTPTTTTPTTTTPTTTTTTPTTTTPTTTTPTTTTPTTTTPTTTTPTTTTPTTTTPTTTTPTTTTPEPTFADKEYPTTVQNLDVSTTGYGLSSTEENKINSTTTDTLQKSGDIFDPQTLELISSADSAKSSLVLITAVAGLISLYQL